MTNMTREQCTYCGCFRDVEHGAEFPAHPDTRYYPTFKWCANAPDGDDPIFGIGLAAGGSE